MISDKVYARAGMWFAANRERKNRASELAQDVLSEAIARECEAQRYGCGAPATSEVWQNCFGEPGSAHDSG